jgi:hypothetical protein
MALPLGLFYPSIGASTEPLGDTSLSSKKSTRLNISQILSRKRISVDSAGFFSSAYRRIQSGNQPESDQPPVLSLAGIRCPSRQPNSKQGSIAYDQIVTPESPGTSIDYSPSRSNISLSLSGFPLPSGKSSESPSVKSRHVEIVIPIWAISLQRFSSSSIDPLFNLGGF